jgi:hypothetical protein
MSNHIELETVIYDDEDNATYISAVLIPGLPARRDCYGAPESPDDDPELEVVASVDEDGHDVDLTDEQTEEAIEQLMNQ